jgi:hypothetical protein
VRARSVKTSHSRNESRRMASRLAAATRPGRAHPESRAARIEGELDQESRRDEERSPPEAEPRLGRSCRGMGAERRVTARRVGESPWNPAVGRRRSRRPAQAPGSGPPRVVRFARGEGPGVATAFRSARVSAELRRLPAKVDVEGCRDLPSERAGAEGPAGRSPTRAVACPDGTPGGRPAPRLPRRSPTIEATWPGGGGL